MTVKELKSKLMNMASRLDNPSLEARLILQQASGLSEIAQIIDAEKPLCDNIAQKAFSLMNKRLSGYPMAYITGSKEFYGHCFYVNEDVLIPRPDTELLVQLTLERAKGITNPKILDLCTGSGAIAASVAYELGVKVSFSDISEKALEVAKQNYRTITGEDGDARIGSLFEPWETECFDIITTNPPYLTQSWYDETEKDVKKEPKLALIGFDSDGLGIIRKIIESAPQKLNKDGYLLIEGDYRQMKLCAKLLTSKGFKDVTVAKDLAGKDRVVYGRRD